MIFSKDITDFSNDFSKSYIYLNKNGECACKARSKGLLGKLVYWQNSELHDVYKKLLDCSFPETYNEDQLRKISQYIETVYIKVDKSRKPSGLAALCVKVHNFLAPYLRMKKIEIFAYSRKTDLLDLKEQVDQMIKKPFKLDTPGLSKLTSLSTDVPHLKTFDTTQCKTLTSLFFPKKTETFGSEAFKLNRPLEMPKFSISERQIKEIVSKPKYQVLNRDEKTKVSELIVSTAVSGFPLIKEAEEKERARLRLRYILFMLLPASPLKPAMREVTEERLIQAFQSCQTVQYEAVNDLYNDLCQNNTLASCFQIRWQKYKEMVFDAWIIERHPGVKSAYADGMEQFPHIKSAYIELLADDLGLPGKEIAQNDKSKAHRSTITKGESTRSMIEKFKEKIKIRDFVLDLCRIINDPKDSLISKELVDNWGKMVGDQSFGYYNPDRNYEGLAKPDDDQEYMLKAYISSQEVAGILKEAKIIS